MQFTSYSSGYLQDILYLLVERLYDIYSDYAIQIFLLFQIVHLADLNSLPLHEPPKSVISKKFRMPTEHTEITSTTLPVNTSQSLTESSDYQLSERKETLLKFKLGMLTIWVFFLFSMFSQTSLYS